MKPHPVYLKAAAGEFLETTDLAKLVRCALKTEFPQTKFAVSCKSYSGGSSISVHWDNGPTVRQVDRIVSRYETKSFDGMIDLAHYSHLWIAPDGTASIAHDEGTQGSMGVHPEVIGSAHHPDAVLADKLSHCYIHTSRHLTADFVAEVAGKLLARYRVTQPSVDAAAIAADYLRGNGHYVTPWCHVQNGLTPEWATWARWLHDTLACRASDRQFLNRYHEPMTA